MKAIIHANIWKNENDALLIDDGIIQKIDSTETILKEITENDEVIDLKESFLLPGFIDSHMHLLKYGFYKSILSLEYASFEEDIKKVLLEHLTKDKWLIARNSKIVTKKLLDEVSKDTPIVVINFDLDCIVCNSKALESSGITESVTYEHGSIDFEEGIVKNKAIPLVLSNYEVSDTELKNYLDIAMKECNHYGITTVCSDDFTSLTDNYVRPLELFSKESYQGNMTVRVIEQCSFNTNEDFANFLDEGYATGIGEDFFEIGPLQMELDDNNGSLYYEDEELQEVIHLANTYNTPTICVTKKEASIEQALRIYKEEVLEGNPLGYGLLNIQSIRQDQIEKVNQMNLNCYGFLKELERSASCSDAPKKSLDVLKGIYTLVKDNISIEDAIYSYTENSSKIIGHSDSLGKIKVGYEADFVVLDTDITKCDVEDILKTKVLMTLVQGNEVYSR